MVYENAKQEVFRMLGGYLRVSSESYRQTTDLQRDALLYTAVDSRHFYEEHASGARDDLPGLRFTTRIWVTPIVKNITCEMIIPATSPYPYSVQAFQPMTGSACRSLRALPVVNFRFVFAEILMAVQVCGFQPERAARTNALNVSKPISVTLSPIFNSAIVSATNALIDFSAWAFASSAPSSSRHIIDALEDPGQ